MKTIFRQVAVLAAVVGSLAMPLSLHARIKGKQDAPTASQQVSQALKSAGAGNIQSATPKQLASALASVAAANKRSKAFVAELTFALIQARPELTLPIAKTILAALTPPGDCPPQDFTNTITMAAIKANPTAAPEITRALIEEYPCRAAVITSAAVAAAPASATKAVVAAALGAAPAGAQIAVRDAAQAAGVDVGLIPINPALVQSPTAPAAPSNSSTTINPTNINGDGGSVPTPVTNSQENATGG